MSPFDKARYERLLEGLEVTEKRLSELERTWRIDAEFFQRQYLRLAQLLEKQHLESVAKVASVSDGNHFSISESFVDEGIPYYRGKMSLDTSSSNKLRPTPLRARLLNSLS